MYPVPVFWYRHSVVVPSFRFLVPSFCFFCTSVPVLGVQGKHLPKPPFWKSPFCEPPRDCSEMLVLPRQRSRKAAHLVPGKGVLRRGGLVSDECDETQAMKTMKIHRLHRFAFFYVFAVELGSALSHPDRVPLAPVQRTLS